MTYVHIYTDGTKDLFIVAAPTWSHKHINDDTELIVNSRLLVPTCNYDRTVSLGRSQIRGVYFLRGILAFPILKVPATELTRQTNCRLKSFFNCRSVLHV
jgi:hypothetical protein